MNQPFDFRENTDGTFSIMIKDCSNSILNSIINPQIPYVWCVNHYIEDEHKWVERKVNLSKDGPLQKVFVRSASFDFFMETEKYLPCVAEFQHQGNLLLQCKNQIPQSLHYLKLPKEQRRRILIQNGIYSEFYLPHEREIASFTCVDRSFIEIVMDRLLK